MPRGVGELSLTEACRNISDLSCDGPDFEVKMILNTSLNSRPDKNTVQALAFECIVAFGFNKRNVIRKSINYSWFSVFVCLFALIMLNLYIYIVWLAKKY